MKIILNKTMRFSKKNYHEGDVVEVPEPLGKELIAQKKAKAVDGATVVAMPVPQKVTAESLKKDSPSVYKAVSESGYEEGFKAGVDEAKAELKRSITLEFLKKEFPEVFDSISEGAFKAGVDEAKKELKSSVTPELIEKEFPEVYKAIFAKGVESKKK